MSTEDGYGMIDGIINNGPKQSTVAELEQQAKSGQPISLMDLMEATRCEQQLDKRPSVLAQLKAKSPEQPQTNKAPTKRAEMEV